jgi:hypothetical protein
MKLQRNYGQTIKNYTQVRATAPVIYGAGQNLVPAN